MCTYNNAAILYHYMRLCDEDDDDEEQFFYESLALLLLNSRRKRRYWIHDTIRKREDLGEFHRLVMELESDDDRFKKYFRLSKLQFNQVLLLMEDDLRKQTTNYRRPVGPRGRLAVALR